MTPEEQKELRRLKRAEANKKRMAEELKQKRERKLKRAERDKEKAKQELAAMNNSVTQSDESKKIRDKFAKRSKATIGQSKNNKKWEQKRKDRYNQKVWKGWRESDGKSAPVKVYRKED